MSDMHILVVMPVTEQHKKQILETANGAEVVFANGRELTQEEVQRATVIVGNVPAALIAGSKNLKLLQLNSAGTDGYTAPGVLPAQATLTNATGAYGLAIAEHMMGMLLCLMKKLDIYTRNMEDHNWEDAGPVTSIYGSRTLVVGLGNIGGEFARRMHDMGSSVTGIRKHTGVKPAYVDSQYSMERFHQSLEEADIVAACLPNTAETTRLFDEEAFAHMKQGAYFLNIGRGNAVDSYALLHALQSGKLSGAAVDVTDPEPLPKDHPLWDAPHLLITPHVSGGYHLAETHNRIIAIACRNIRHLQNGETFENVVDMTTGYRIPTDLNE